MDNGSRKAPTSSGKSSGSFVNKAFFEAAVIGHHTDKRGDPFAEMFHFVLAVVAAAAGLAEIHRDMLPDFEVAFDIFADFDNGAGGLMAEDFNAGAHRGDGQGTADSAGRKRRADCAFKNLGSLPQMPA